MFGEASVPVGLCVHQEGYPGKSSAAAGNACDPVQAARNVAKEQRYQLGASFTGVILVDIGHTLEMYKYCTMLVLVSQLQRQSSINRECSKASITNRFRISWGGAPSRSKQDVICMVPTFER